MKKGIVIGSISIVAAIAVIVAIVFATADGRALKKQLDLGYKYLQEMDYEQAIAAFNRVIEIDPANEQAYIGLANSYFGMGDLTNAIEALNRGIDIFEKNGNTSAVEELTEWEKRISGDYIDENKDTGSVDQNLLNNDFESAYLACIEEYAKEENIAVSDVQFYLFNYDPSQNNIPELTLTRPEVYNNTRAKIYTFEAGKAVEVSSEPIEMIEVAAHIEEINGKSAWTAANDGFVTYDHFNYDGGSAFWPEQFYPMGGQSPRPITPDEADAMYNSIDAANPNLVFDVIAITDLVVPFTQDNWDSFITLYR